MLQNIIRSRRNRDCTLKIVYGTENEAEDSLDVLESHRDENDIALNKMMLLYNLKDIQLTTVANNLFIVYHFKNSKDAKEFEISFTRNIYDDGSNLIESFMIAQKEKEEAEEEQFKIKLTLPTESIKALDSHKSLMSVMMESEPSCPIYRDMAYYNNKSIRLADKDFDKPIVNIITIFNGSKVIRSVPQRWLEIEEISYKGIINAQWALNPKNIIKMVNGGVLSMFNNKEVLTPMEVIKIDGSTVTLFKREDGYYEPKSGLTLSAEHIIIK